MSFYSRFLNYFGFKGLSLRTLVFARSPRKYKHANGGNPRFVIYRSSNRLYYFDLIDEKGHTLLKSEGYFHYSKCQADIILVKQSVVFINRYKTFQSKEGYFFELYTSTGIPIAKSNLFKSGEERDSQIPLLIKYARFAPVEDSFLQVI